MDSGLLEGAILDVMADVMPDLLPNEIIDVTVTETINPDGSVSVTQTNVLGPVRLDEDGRRNMLPLARAISRAVVRHLEEHASVDLVTGRIS